MATENECMSAKDVAGLVLALLLEDLNKDYKKNIALKRASMRGELSRDMQIRFAGYGQAISDIEMWQKRKMPTYCGNQCVSVL